MNPVWENIAWALLRQLPFIVCATWVIPSQWKKMKLAFTDELWEGIATITNNNLNILEKNFKEILKRIDGIKRGGGFPDGINDEYCQNVKQGIQKAPKKINSRGSPIC